MSEELNRIEALVEKISAYLNTRLSQVKLSAAEKMAKLVSMLIAVLMAALVFFLVITLLCIALALLLSEWLKSYWLGFMLMSGIVLFLGLLAWTSRDRWLRIPIMNALIDLFFNDKDDE